jgi:hypothetical protein
MSDLSCEVYHKDFSENGKNNLLKMSKNAKLNITTKTKEKQMSVATTTYKVGDLYTSQKSKITGVIKEIVPAKNGATVRVKLDVNGSSRWTTWTAKQ